MAMIYPSEYECAEKEACKFFDTQYRNKDTVCICNIVNRPLKSLGECPWDKINLAKKRNQTVLLEMYMVECYNKFYKIVVDLEELE